MHCQTQQLPLTVRQPIKLSAHWPQWAATVIQSADTLAFWYERSRQRSQLMSLPDHILKDVGISREDALREGSKPFWRD